MNRPSYDRDFPGKIGKTFRDSSPWMPEPPRGREGAPNIIFVVLDDVGYSDLGCFGSEIETPHMDRLAAAGVQYTNFHVTSMCSPTRACLITGRNAHSVGMGTIAEWAGGYPSYRGHISMRAGTIAEMLREQFYSTFAVGKWHLTPMNEVTPAGPFQNWPLGRGFDRWYGFHGAFTDQWHPELFIDNHAIEPQHPDSYHLSEDLVDQSISFIRNHRAAAPDRPYFLYLAMGACHWPHHVPQAVVAKYRRRYAAGWEALRRERAARQKALGVVPENTMLPAANPGVPPWEQLSEEERTFAERSQELFAGFLDHTDQQIGRLLAYLDHTGQMDDTLIVLLSDNGASAEGGPLGVVSLNARKHLYHGPETASERSAAVDSLGGPRTYPHYAQGWAQLSNTPLKWYKMNTYGGGIRAPLVMHWPARIRQPGLRPQYHHVIDIVPTVLEILDVQAPAVYRGVEQVPVQGTSMFYTLDRPDAPTRKLTQHFELAGDRAIWHDGWKAVAKHEAGSDFDADNWELYHLDADFSECRNLASTEPDRLRQLVRLWWDEAERHEVLPLDDRKGARETGARRIARRKRYDFTPGLDRIDRINAPDMTGISFSITADVEIPDEGAQGVLIAFGTALAGYTLFIKDGAVVHEYVYSDAQRHILRSPRPLAAGRHVIHYDFARRQAGAALATLSVDGKAVDSCEVPRSWPNRAVHGGLTCGRDSGLAVSDAYAAPFEFTGRLRRVTIELSEEGGAQRPHDSRSALIEE
ncbi:MAG: arylsulfatase [Burkholderiaceae bacterium]